MRNLLITTLLALAGMFNAAAMTDGHTLTDLWKKYQEAHKADRPQKEAEILSQIKKEALSKHLPVDFYDAACEYVNTVQRRDWKQRDQLRENLAKEVKKFDNPLVTFHWMKDWDGAGTRALWEYVQANPKGFRGNTPALHRGVDSYINGALLPFIGSDKEYVLWYLVLGRSPVSELKDQLYQALQEELKGVYPAAGILEFCTITRQYYPQDRREQKKADLQALQLKYQGKALALYPEAELLLMAKEDLDQRKAAGEEYKNLYRNAQLFEKRRSAFRGEEATLAAGCKSIKGLCERLETQSLDLEVDSENIQVIFQNLYHANVTLRKEKSTVQTWKAVNFAESFYVLDTVKIPLPKLPDGTYTIEAVSGKHSCEQTYTQYTLSIATRTDGNGRSVYVADYKTGEPLQTVSLRLKKGDKELASTTLMLNGFTPLPAAFDKAIKDAGTRAYLSVEAASGDRLSQPVTLNREFGPYHPDQRVRCNLYRDRGAYNPGDVLKFKAVVYQGDPMLNLSVCKGKKLEVEFTDSEGNVLETQKLTTNEWGTVSGEFSIPTGLRNGYFGMSVKDLAYESFRVDEFELPSFDLSFDSLSQLYMVGDSIPVTGKVSSFSGHSLSGARIALSVSHYGDGVLEQEGVLEEGGLFAFSFPATQSGYYHAQVNVTDATGETLEFGTGYYVSDNLSIETTVMDALNADVAVTPQSSWRYGRTTVVGSKQLKVKLEAQDAAGNPVPLPVEYAVLAADEKVVAKGSLPSGSVLEVQLPASGLYTLKTRVSAQREGKETISEDAQERILCTLPSDEKLCAGVRRLFLPGDLTLPSGEDIVARLGSAEGKVYAVVTLYGDTREVLETHAITVEKGCIGKVQLPYLDSYPDAVRLQIFYFLGGDALRLERQYRRAKDKYTLPLSFTRFQDKAFPGTQYSFQLKTAPGTEVLVAAWDKSMDAICPNPWPEVTLRDYSVESVSVNSVCGVVAGSGGYGGPMLYSVRERTMAKSAGSYMMNVALEDGVEMEQLEVSGAPMPEAADEGVKARTDFSSALTFQPHLYPDASGTVNFSFSTSDKLSTYYVRVYAHNKEMKNASLQQEMVVSLPVKVSLLEPRFLYRGDVWEAAVTVSSMADTPVSGTMVLRAGESVQQLPVTVKPGQTVSKSFTVQCPSSCHSEQSEESLTVKASFVAADFSDAVQVTIPVYPAAQTLTEAHSAVLHAGEDREALLERLQGLFVNVPSSAATLREITVLDMVKDAIPSHVEPRCSDVLSLSEAWYIRLMASRLACHSERSEESPLSNEDLLSKILCCRNADGGFAWFEGMPSNAIITAVLLERFALLRDRGFEVPDMSATVKFLDNKQFGTSFPLWCGWVSDAQYMRVRAMYAEVPFSVKAVSATQRKRLKEFKKDAKEYLLPSKKDGRGLQGQILAKARRLLTLRTLSASKEGVALAKAWGLSVGAKMEQSIKADVVSLLEYAVEHRDGGWYYPNAVMPWRGLLENEAYAHALLCQLLSSCHSERSEESPAAQQVADGIRLWLMLQKETQKWDTEPAFIDAITAILDGSEKVLNTRVLALSATYTAPFQEIKAAGNGFTIERSFFKDGVEIHPGEPVSVGDKISVKYQIWNAEYRSFVRLTAGREASLRPVEQLSGHVGWGLIRPLRSGYVWSFTPSGYRNVKASATEFYFDSYPEEKTTLQEDFFVTEAGRFQAPVVEIESLYAPHYRANSAFRPSLDSNLD